MATDRFGGTIKEPSPNVPASRVDRFGGLQLLPEAPFIEAEFLPSQSRVPTGGLGYPVPREQARDIAAQRVVSREREAGFMPGDLLLRAEAEQLAKDAGIPVGDLGDARAVTFSQLPDTLQGNIMRAIVGTRGAASGMTLGASEALNRVLDDLILSNEQRQIFGSQELKKRSEPFALGGEMIGSLAPTTGLARATIGAPSLVKKALEGSKTGIAMGATSGLTGTISERGIEATPEEIAGGVLLSGGIGGTIGAASPYLAKGLEKTLKFSISPQQTLAAIRAERLDKTTRNTLADIGKFTGADAFKQERLLAGEYNQAIADVAPYFKAESGVDGYLDATNKALKERAKTFSPIVKAGSPFQYEPQNLTSRIDEKLSINIPEPASRAAALTKVRDFIQNVRPENVLEFSGQLNDDLIRFYKSAAPEASADLAFAKKAVRDVYSDIIKTTLDDAKADPDLYSRYGLLNELQESIGNNFRKESVAHAATQGKGFIGRLKESEASLLTPRGAIMASGKAAAPVLGGEPARLNKQINNLMSKISPSKVMTKEERNILITSARSKRADLDKVAEFQQALNQAELERAASSASPEELPRILSDLMNESVSIKEAGDVRREILKTLPKAMQQRVKDLKAQSSDDLLSDYYHFLNTSEDITAIARMESELRRRLDLKKYNKNLPEIRDALNIPSPTKGSDLPTKRELNVSERVKESLSKRTP